MSSALATRYPAQNGEISAEPRRSYEPARFRAIRARQEALSSERFSRLAARLAEHFCSRESLQEFWERALDDVVEETGSGHGWIVRFDPEGAEVETLVHRAAPGESAESEERSWGCAVSVLSRLVSGDSSFEQAVLDDGGRTVAATLHDGLRALGALVLYYPEAEAVPDGSSRFLVRVAKVLSAYLRGSLRPPRRAEIARSEEGCDRRFPPGMVGRSSALVRIVEKLERIAPTGATVLIEGESGTGKELVARAIHQMSPRADKPWVVVNCAAIPEQLVESELFGHERGAFTGALQTKTGRFEQADAGTIFLDEVGEMPLSLQAKLLRFLQERTLQRLGAGRDIRVDVRFVVATNRDLSRMKEEGTFREDLYWRLYVVPIRVPPLRDRPEDVRPLVEHFVHRFSAELRRDPPRIDPSVIECLETYAWPGNVRQLENLIHRLMILATGGRVVRQDLPLEMRAGDRVASIPRPGPFRDLLSGVPGSYEELQDRRRDLLRIAARCASALEDRFVDSILERHRGNKSRAAADSGMHRTMIHRNLRKRGRAAR